MTAALVLGLALAAIAVSLFVRALVVTRIRGSAMVNRVEAYGFRGQPVEPGRRQSALAGFDGAAELVGRFVADRASSIRLPALRQELLRAGLYTATPHKLIGYQAFPA